MRNHPLLLAVYVQIDSPETSLKVGQLGMIDPDENMGTGAREEHRNVKNTKRKKVAHRVNKSRVIGIQGELFQTACSRSIILIWLFKILYSDWLRSGPYFPYLDRCPGCRLSGGMFHPCKLVCH